MPKIKNLCTACEESFSVDGPISEEALQRVLTILDKIRPSDVGLEQEAYVARNWNNPSHDSNGRREPNGTDQDMPPIKYMHIHECETFSMGIFCMPPSSIIPLHDHPGMTVLSKLLYGELHVESYDWIDVNDQTEQLKARPAKLFKDCEMSRPQTTVLFPDRGGNIHTFRAITPCAVFDVLCPPYLPGVGRDCSYFKKSSLNESPAPNCSEVVWLDELEGHQPPEGFSVTSGSYKGPIIR
ncbi:plant cysteine oxidase 5 isoform X1 [Lolium perenne]|uniref:plant cysteine oxidase 5 isoform X1 n=1 Tax=Lolium perenne TaxID=4522 RepID=UPI0021F5B54E|nr:plant cysteine oxidase 5-like isoform X1 [Lolium perenne]